MPNNLAPTDRAQAFCTAYGLKFPILLAPMASACPSSLSVAVANAGGMGAMGALLNEPPAIEAWVQELLSLPLGATQLLALAARAGLPATTSAIAQSDAHNGMSFLIIRSPSS